MRIIWDENHSACMFIFDFSPDTNKLHYVHGDSGHWESKKDLVD